MNGPPVRSLLIGSTRYVLPASALAGLAAAGTVIGLTEFVLDLPPAPVFVVLVIPVSIVLTHYGGGLASSWVAVFPYVEYALWKYPCAGLPDGLCVAPPGPAEVLAPAAVVAVITGTVGYGFSKVVEDRHEDPAVTVGVAYFVAVTTLAGLLVIVLDRFVLV